MAENETMEGKDLAKEEKKEFKAEVLEQIAKLKNGESAMIIGELEATKLADQTILKVRGKAIAIARDGTTTTIEYNVTNFEKLKAELAEEGQTLEDLGLPDLQTEIDKIQKQNSKEGKEQEENDGNKENDGEEFEEEEKDDEKPELEEEDKENQDEKKEEIAKKYNVNVKHVIHISNDEKITEDERFKGLVNWAKDQEEVYIVPGDDLYTYKVVGEKEGKQEEIEQATNQMIDGKNPSITVKRIDGDKITEVQPLAMYKNGNDKDSAVAIIINEHGEREALYCRAQAGDKKEFWGEVIPEASGKNVLQQDPETRKFMDHKYNSKKDLDKKADAYERQKDLEERGLPSEKEGVQVEEIEGKYKQNAGKNIEDIENELMSRDGVIDKATVPPGYYENKAKKVLAIMESNEDITYENAVEQVEEQGKREAGGRTQGEQGEDPRRG